MIADEACGEVRLNGQTVALVQGALGREQVHTEGVEQQRVFGYGCEPCSVQNDGANILVPGDVPHVQCRQPADGLARAQTREYRVGISLEIRKFNRRTYREARCSCRLAQHGDCYCSILPAAGAADCAGLVCTSVTDCTALRNASGPCMWENASLVPPLPVTTMSP